MRGRPSITEPLQPTPAALPSPVLAGFPTWSVSSGPRSPVCVTGTQPMWPGRARLLWAPPRHSGPAPVLCSSRTVRWPLRRPSADRRQGSPPALVWKSLCWEAGTVFVKSPSQGPLMGSIRSAWHSEALLCLWGPLGSCESGPLHIPDPREAERQGLRAGAAGGR